MTDLFAPDPAESAPLADRLRPRLLDEVVGQEHLTGAEGAIGRMVAAGRLSSLVLWGPPGTGKTTPARRRAAAAAGRRRAAGRAAARRRRRPALRRRLRRLRRRRRPQEGVRRRAGTCPR